MFESMDEWRAMLAGLPQHEVDEILDSMLATSGVPEDQYDTLLEQWVTTGAGPGQGDSSQPGFEASLRQGPGPELDQVLHALIGRDGEGLPALREQVSDDQVLTYVRACAVLEQRTTWLRAVAVSTLHTRWTRPRVEELLNPDPDPDSAGDGGADVGLWPGAAARVAEDGGDRQA